MRGRWLVCLVVMGCSGGVGGSDGNAHLGEGESSGTSGMNSSATTGTSAESGTSSPSGTTAPTGPDTTGDPTSSTGSSTDPDATGQPSCDEHWRVQPVASGLTDIAYDAPSDTIFAVGNDADTPWAASLDGCNGGTLSLSNLTHPGATSTYVRRVLASDEGLFVAGSVVLDADPGNGMYARLDPNTLARQWSQPLAGNGGFMDEVLQLTMSNAGTVWMAGTARLNDTPAAWTINGTTDGSACGFSAGSAGPGSARAIAADGDTIVVAMRPSAAPGGLVLLGYDQACTCMCQPQWTSATIEIGTSDTSIGDMVVVDGQLYVAGWARDGAGIDLFGYVAWLDGNGTLLGTYTDDVTPNGEGFLTLAAVGGTLYVGGGQAWDGQPGFDSANARLHAIPIPWGGSPTPTWTTLPQDLDIVEGLAASADYVYVGGTADGVATVLRCDTDGDCG